MSSLEDSVAAARTTGRRGTALRSARTPAATPPAELPGAGVPIRAAKPRKGKSQCAALPVRRLDDGRMEVMLVTSRETRRWVLPKGWCEEGLTPGELAAKEALEEAGLIGAVAEAPTGHYVYGKRLRDGREVPVKVAVHPMRVEGMLEDWPERCERERRWFAPDEAAELVDEAELALLLRGLRDRIAPP